MKRKRPDDLHSTCKYWCQGIIGFKPWLYCFIIKHYPSSIVSSLPRGDLFFPRKRLLQSSCYYVKQRNWLKPLSPSLYFEWRPRIMDPKERMFQNKNHGLKCYFSIPYFGGLIHLYNNLWGHSYSRQRVEKGSKQGLLWFFQGLHLTLITC